MSIFFVVLVILVVHLLLAFFYIFFSKITDYLSLETQLFTLLPDQNCGLCGYKLCEQYAQSILEQTDLAYDKCRKQNVYQKIIFKKLLEKAKFNITSTISKDKIAFINCAGGSTKKLNYNGISTCYAVHDLALNTSHCLDACDGLGDCLKVCPENAIFINKNHSAEIDSNRCNGCGYCLNVCFKQLITLTTIDKKPKIACASCAKCEDSVKCKNLASLLTDDITNPNTPNLDITSSKL